MLALHGLVGACFASGLGTAMAAVAVPWLVLELTGSAVLTGVVGFAQLAPYVLLQATAGPLVDRAGLRRSVLVGNAIAAVALGVAAAVVAFHAAGPDAGTTAGASASASAATASAAGFWPLAALVAVSGAARGLADAATAPLLPVVAEAARMPIERATGVYAAGNRGALLVGMPLGGALVALVGAGGVLVVDALAFCVAVVIVASVVPAVAGRQGGATGSLGLRTYAHQLAEGMRFLRTDRLLLGIVAMVAVTNLLDEALTSVLLPVWASDRGHGSAAFGLIGGALGLGALIGVILGAWLGPRLPRWATYAICTVLSGAPPFFALAAWSSVPAVLAVAVVCGALGGVLNPIVGAVQFERIPPRMHARVLGAVKASAWVGIPFGSLVGGALTAAVGLTAALLLSGAAMLLMTLAPFVFPAWRGLDRQTPPVLAGS
jgi:MFS family permease